MLPLSMPQTLRSRRECVQLSTWKAKYACLQFDLRVCSYCSVSVSCLSLSPLHLAAHSGLKQTVQELLSRGASVQLLDENGVSP